MTYIPTKWKDSPSTETPIDASCLNNLENAVALASNKVTATATLNSGWSAGSAVGLDFVKIGNLVIANFAASISIIEGNQMFIGTVPEGMRPPTITPLPAVFVPNGSSDYHPRMVMVNTDGTVQIAKSPTEAGAFFCAMVYFV